MESKIIKVKTDGDILRDANVVAGFGIDGSEYVVYYIDRDDGENDNIFVSKLIKNTDGTYNMLDIENANEKIAVSNIIKDLIKVSVTDNDNDNLNSDTYTFASGKVVNIFSLIINREQSIDIQKTYITTVKKAVTEIARKYYEVKVVAQPEVVEETLDVDSLFSNVLQPARKDEAVVSDPIANNDTSESVSETPIVEPQITETVPTPVEIALPEMPVLEEVPEATPELEIPADLLTPEPEPAPISEIPVSEPANAVPNVIEPAPEPVSVESTVVESVPEAVTLEPAVVEPVLEPAHVEPTVPEPVSEPVKNEPDLIVLDGSKESNLNSALGEAGKDILSANNIDAIKDFGTDEPVTQTNNPEVVPAVPSNTSESGFANNKFFVFVALAFFTGSCVFLGYEVFNYFQMVK